MTDRGIYFGGVEDVDRANRSRRRDLARQNFRHDPNAERMAAQLEADPEEFDRVYGARGAITVGLYQRAKDAAADPDEAA